MLNLSCSYSNGLLHRQTNHSKSTCKSGEIYSNILFFQVISCLFFLDSHCLCSLKFNSRRNHSKSVECECTGQFQFELDHCDQLLNYFN